LDLENVRRLLRAKRMIDNVCIIITPNFGGHQSYFLWRHTTLLRLQAAGNSHFPYCTYSLCWLHQIAIFNSAVCLHAAPRPIYRLSQAHTPPIRFRRMVQYTSMYKSVLIDWLTDGRTAHYSTINSCQSAVSLQIMKRCWQRAMIK